jgi:hypothetical protein
MAQQTPAKQLFDLLVSRDFDPELLDAAGKPADDPSEAEVFSFDFVAQSGKNYGTVVVMLGTDHNLEVYSGDNVGKTMEGSDKNEWFSFLEQLKHFSTRNLMSFGVKNINRLRYSMQGQAAIKEGLFESWRGTKTVSYNDRPEAVRLMIKHKKPIEEGDARFRYVESLFVETADGERFKLPFTKLAGGRAMVEHIRNGGRPYDLRGQHIAAVVEELNVLSRFRRANHGKIFEGDTAALITETNTYYETLNRVLKGLSSHRGYTNYFENWNPAEVTEQDVIIENIKSMFVRQDIDTRIEQALPILARISQQGHAMKEANIFESWATRLMEGTWALPDTPEQKEQLVVLLSKELPVGADATNATEQLYDLLGDDILFDQLETLADQDANADARALVINRLQELSDDPNVAQVLAALDIDADAAEVDVDVDAEKDVREGTFRDEDGGADEDDMDEGIPGNLPPDQIPGKEKLLKTPATKPQGVADKVKDVLGGIKDFVSGKPEDPSRPTYEADNLSTFEEGRCNMTAEGTECPKHGMSECWSKSAADTGDNDMLSRLKALSGIVSK